MFFSFQTPTSEYAQALVDFHHYAFFYFILVTIFVVWMIKFSLSFVIEETNLTFFSDNKTSNFFFIEENLWFKKNGEISYLFRSICFSLVYFGLKILNKVEIFTKQLPIFLFIIQISTQFLIKYFNEFILLTKQLHSTSAAFIYTSLQYFEWNNVLKQSFINPTFNLNILTNKGFMNLSKNTLLYNSNLLVKLSFIPTYFISSVKTGVTPTRVSSWTWCGEYQDLFIFFNGFGDNYPFNLDEYAGLAFDENLYMPQAFDFSNFYSIDLWKNPFLFFQNVRHRIVLEWVWTFIPTIILVILVIPSLYLLYSYDKPYVTAPYLTFKAVGHQWYWSYEYCDFNPNHEGNLNFDSYMLHEDDLTLGQLRLLEVDRRVILPAGVCIRMLTTSADVLHSWAIPAFGVKMDSVPGRLNQFWLVLNKPGIFYGQCSEICGVNHGFMPIAVEVVYLDQYLEFILSKMSE